MKINEIPKDIKVGDLVSVDHWDETVHPKDMLGSPARVVKVSQGRPSGSGVMVLVEGALGKTMPLDKDWLRVWMNKPEVTDVTKTIYPSDMTSDPVEPMHKRIARHLFNYKGNQAVRLEFMRPDRLPCGGWSEAAAADQIRRVLNGELN